MRIRSLPQKILILEDAISIVETERAIALKSGRSKYACKLDGECKELRVALEKLLREAEAGGRKGFP